MGSMVFCKDASAAKSALALTVSLKRVAHACLGGEMSARACSYRGTNESEHQGAKGEPGPGNKELLSITKPHDTE